MTNRQHLEPFVKLGHLFDKFCENGSKHEGWVNELKTTIDKAQSQNAWFTPDNVWFTLRYWATTLNREDLEQWQSKYSSEYPSGPQTVGIIMAGNIPLVGFHDFLCVLLAGHRVLAKLSSNDKTILPFIVEFLIAQDSTLAEKITITNERLENFEAVIATGSNNTSRYFEYYFGKYPNIIRKNRTSVAVLSGGESREQLELLGEDIFRYFGLGCRNVSKLFVPQGYDFDTFFSAIFSWKNLLEHHKYTNNYDYNKAVFLMSEISILDNGFLILKEDQNYGSPIGCLFFEYYEDQGRLREKLNKDKAEIQCVVAHGLLDSEISFGETQKPKLHEYADGIDTMQFLGKLVES